MFLTIFIFSLGFILLGIALVLLRLLNLLSGICLALGAPLFWIGALFVSQEPMGNVVTEIGATLFGLGLILLGKQLLSNFNATESALP
ncbi:MAG TPA: hypothetical protein DDZ80_15900 [Cyanobacteria bacterium UBA8803]|nr:hypothetical protein [Cyanobacteria bacterium UBA9273]HBL59899.1 hypothetical protein [Cyanobacteria bacterium UBA8803]